MFAATIIITIQCWLSVPILIFYTDMCIAVLRVLRTEGQMRHLLDVMDQDHLMWRVAGTCDQ